MNAEQPILLVFDVPVLSAEGYDRILAALEAVGAGAPDGRLYHAAAPKGEGWLVFDLWRSMADIEAFVPTLMPILAREVGTPPPPSLYPAHHVIPG